MFRLRKSERAAFEAHIADLKEEIHWLRSCIPWAVPVGTTRPVGAATPPPLVVEPLQVDEQDDFAPRGPLAPLSEEEEDVVEAVKRGDLTEEEGRQVLKLLGSVEEIEFT